MHSQLEQLREQPQHVAVICGGAVSGSEAAAACAERGMTAVNGRSGRRLSLAYSSELFGQDRQTIDEAFPGDVIGVVNASGVQVGDTLS